MARLLALALLLLGACRSREAASRSAARPARPPAAFVGLVPNDEGCGRMRATCDAAKIRCERRNRHKRPSDRDPLLVPCDLEHDVCLGRCRPGREAPP